MRAVPDDCLATGAAHRPVFVTGHAGQSSSRCDALTATWGQRQPELPTCRCHIDPGADGTDGADGADGTDGADGRTYEVFDANGSLLGDLIAVSGVKSQEGGGVHFYTIQCLYAVGVVRHW